MSVPPEVAAQALLSFLALPKGVVSVWVWDSNGRPKLIVRLAPSWMWKEKEIPSSFEGFKVEITERDVATLL